MQLSAESVTTFLDLLGLLAVFAAVAVLAAAAVGGVVGVALGLAVFGVLTYALSWVVSVTRRGGGRL